MKNYTVTVNGNVYDVTVEENGESSPSAQTSKPAPKVKEAPAKSETPAKKSSGAGSIKVTAPMPGKVLSIPATVGQSVKKGDTVLVFEAMKMENTVVAPENGTVVDIAVEVGDSFEADEVLVSMD